MWKTPWNYHQETDSQGLGLCSGRTGPPGDSQVGLFFPTCHSRQFSSCLSRKSSFFFLFSFLLKKEWLFIPYFFKAGTVFHWSELTKSCHPSLQQDDVTQLLYDIKEVAISITKSNFLRSNSQSAQPYQIPSSGMQTHG